MLFDRKSVDLSPAEFHATDFGEAGRRMMIIPHLNYRKTLVLGSTQPESDFDAERCRRLGVEIARRRSGGGAVLVSDSDIVWFDLFIGSDDPLWNFDVAVAFEWVGRACRDALAALGHETEMHTGALATGPWSRQICFAGTGPGELRASGKVVGISQRRTRDTTRFQVAILRRWDAAEHAELLNLSNDERRRAAAELSDAGEGVGDDVDAILDAVALRLPV